MTNNCAPAQILEADLEYYVPHQEHSILVKIPGDFQDAVGQFTRSLTPNTVSPTNLGTVGAPTRPVSTELLK
jgi:hypothetical protein